MDFWDAIHQWQQAIGAIIGFLALAAAALFNAYLNRKRDDRLRKTDAKLIACALRSEVQGIVMQLRAINRFNKNVPVKTPLDAARKLKTITLPVATVYPQIVMKIGLLSPEVAEIVMQFYEVLAALRRSLNIEMPDLEPIEGEERWFAIAGGENVVIGLHKANQVVPKLIEVGEKSLHKLENSIAKN